MLDYCFKNDLTQTYSLARNIRDCIIGFDINLCLGHVDFIIRHVNSCEVTCPTRQVLFSNC